MATRPTPPPLARAALIAAGVVALQALLMLWFAWPAEKTAPRDVPVVIAGPAPAVTALSGKLSAEGAFQVTSVPDAASADAALRARSAYAAFVVGPSGLSLHVASAASPTVAVAARPGRPAVGLRHPGPGRRRRRVPSGRSPRRRVRLRFPPVAADQCRGWGRAAVRGAVACRALGRGDRLRRAGRPDGGRRDARSRPAHRLLLGAAGAITLLALAVTGSVSGLGALLGNAGIGLGVLLVFLLGNPISGLASAPELLPQPWGAIGQYLPPGAGATLLRSAAFFGGAGSAAALWVLLSLGDRRARPYRRRPLPRPAPVDRAGAAAEARHRLSHISRTPGRRPAEGAAVDRTATVARAGTPDGRSHARTPRGRPGRC